ncbi:MAG: hypothetical protein BGN99_00345 [Alphaproteobacteria bacterium 65-37]|nr:hypothetical protein [Alphaproteobacteria bacterium]OJU47247.1 MAG: hypothetical protein BGN99_00345 [Alphaproteobacteria bacterium 65-37]
MTRALVVLAAALLATGCAPTSFTKEGKQDATMAEQYARDEGQCRSQAKTVAGNERNIEDQRRAVFAGDRDRFGQQDLYRTMDNQGYQNNFDRLVARCMEARGWTPKKTGPIQMPKLSW